MKATGTDAASLLFPAAYRRQVLALLLLHPDRKVHVREISRLTGTTPGTMNKELARLHGAGLLDRERVGNQLRYSANRAHPLYPELSAILRKTVGLADVLVEALAPLGDCVKAAFVFGSMARGTATAASDVDLAVIGSVEFGVVVDALHGAERKLGREINPKVFSEREWKQKVKSRDAFVMEILGEPRIVLVGSQDELGSPRRRQP